MSGLPFELLLPGMYGRWGAVSMLLASVLTLGTLLLLMPRLESRFPLAAGARLRNLLRSTPQARDRYESEKVRLADQYKNDRAAYTTGKAHVVKSLLAGTD